MCTDAIPNFGTDCHKNYLGYAGPEEAISHWSGKIQAACKALNRVVLEHLPGKLML